MNHALWNLLGSLFWYRYVIDIVINKRIQYQFALCIQTLQNAILCEVNWKLQTNLVFINILPELHQHRYIYIIKLFTQVKLCFVTATHNFKTYGNVANLMFISFWNVYRRDKHIKY